MKFKSILLFVVLVAIIASFSLVSCHKDEPVGDVYSEWMDMTAADSVIYARARTAYLEDPANKGTADFMIMQILSQNPYAVRTEAVEKGLNYQFACRDEYFITVYKGNGDNIGKVIEIAVGYDNFPAPIPPDPRKRDTLIY